MPPPDAYACVATRLAQGVSALTQLRPAPSQLQAPPTAGDAAHGPAAQCDDFLPGGHAAIHIATERTPQTAVPLLRCGDGDRAPAHRAPGVDQCHAGAARCSTRGNHALSSQHRSPLAASMPMGVVAALVSNIAIYIQPPLQQGWWWRQEPPASGNDRHPAMRAGQTSRSCFLCRRPGR